MNWKKVVLLVIILAALGSIISTGLAQSVCLDDPNGNSGPHSKAQEGTLSIPTPPPQPEAPTPTFVGSAMPGTPPAGPAFTEVDQIETPMGTIDPDSGQFTEKVWITPPLPQIAPDVLPTGGWIWHGSKSVYEPATEYPLWPRPMGFHWRGDWDDCLLDAEPGGTVERVCAYGLWLAKTSLDVAGYRVIELLGAGPNSTFTEYYYTPYGDGTRLVYEYHNGGGVWFREFPDGRRVEYEGTTNTYTPQGKSSPVAHLRIKRIYRGSYSSPDWQITFTWDSSDRLCPFGKPV